MHYFTSSDLKYSRIWSCWGVRFQIGRANNPPPPNWTSVAAVFSNSTQIWLHSSCPCLTSALSLPHSMVMEDEKDLWQRLQHITGVTFTASVDGDGEGFDLWQCLLYLAGILLVGAVLLAVERVGQLSVHFECFRCVLHLWVHTTSLVRELRDRMMGYVMWCVDKTLTIIIVCAFVGVHVHRHVWVYVLSQYHYVWTLSQMGIFVNLPPWGRQVTFPMVS